MPNQAVCPCGSCGSIGSSSPPFPHTGVLFVQPLTRWMQAAGQGAGNAAAAGAGVHLPGGAAQRCLHSGGAARRGSGAWGGCGGGAMTHASSDEACAECNAMPWARCWAIQLPLRARHLAPARTPPTLLRRLRLQWLARPQLRPSIDKMLTMRMRDRVGALLAVKQQLWPCSLMGVEMGMEEDCRAHPHCSDGRGLLCST